MVRRAAWRTETALVSKEVKRAKLRAQQSAPPLQRFAAYRDDPVGYCRQVLKVSLTESQEKIARLLLHPPYRVLVPSAHNVGKSFVGACLVSWRFDCHGGAIMTTAPTDRQVKGILWKELRRLRARAGLGGFAGPKAPRLEGNDGRWAHGFTARDAAGFQGQHEHSVFIYFDEGEGVASGFWEAAETMRGPTDPMLVTYNPIRADTQAYIEEQAGGWHVEPLSAIDHPNIKAELAGKSPPYPSAIRLQRLREQLNRWGTPLTQHSKPQAGDVMLAEGEWYRPGPVAEARCLGRRASRSVNGVWSDWAWNIAISLILPETGPLQVGCDVARYGDDMTAIHARKGGVSLSHEEANGWSIPQTAERCKQVAHHYGTRYGVNARSIPIAVDDCGIGGGVSDLLGEDGFNVYPVNAQCLYPDQSEFHFLRDALWFGLSEAAAEGLISLARLHPETLARLRAQALAPTYQMDVRGRRCVEPKDRTKQRIGRSPDGMDAANLAYLKLAQQAPRVAGRVSVP